MSDTPPPDPAPIPVTLETPGPKPGHKTSEFALSVAAMFLSALFAADVVPTTGAVSKVAIIAAIMLTSLGYTVSRTRVKASGMSILFVVFAFGVAPHTMACGSARTKVINVTMVSADTANAAFVAFDAAKQDAIVKDATSLADGEKSLLAWRAKQTQVRVLFDNLYRAIAMAKMVDDDASVASMMRAAKLVQETLASLGVKL